MKIRLSLTGFHIIGLSSGKYRANVIYIYIIRLLSALNEIKNAPYKASTNINYAYKTQKLPSESVKQMN